MTNINEGVEEDGYFLLRIQNHLRTSPRVFVFMQESYSILSLYGYNLI